MQRKFMIDFFLFWLPIVGTILLGSIAVAEWYSGVRVRAIWFGFGGTVCFLLVVALQAPARELRRIATIGAASYPFNDFNDVPVGEDRAVLGPGGAVDFGPMKMSRNLTPADARPPAARI
jgi:hypothetical protein